MDATRELAAYEHASSLEVAGRDLHRMLMAYPEARAKGEALCNMNREIERARKALDAFEAIVARESRDLSVSEREARFIVSFSTGEAA
mgnify:CR=1 FL=1